MCCTILRALRKQIICTYVDSPLKLFNDCLSVNKKVVLAWVPSHVGIKGNEKADDLAKQALNFNVLDLKVPYTDLKVNVNSVFKQKWQAQWNACPDNKLFQINPTVGDFYVWTGLSRREEIVKRPARDACLCMGEIPAPPTPPAPHFVFLITL